MASFGRRVPKKKHLKLQARRQRVKKVMKMLRGVPKTHVLGQPYSVLCSRFMMDFNQNVQKPWVFEAIDFIGANAMNINARPLTGAVTMFLPVLTLARLGHIVQTKCHVANTEAMDVIATLPGTRLCVFREIHFQAVELER